MEVFVETEEEAVEEAACRVEELIVVSQAFVQAEQNLLDTRSFRRLYAAAVEVVNKPAEALEATLLQAKTAD